MEFLDLRSSEIRWRKMDEIERGARSTTIGNGQPAGGDPPSQQKSQGLETAGQKGPAERRVDDY